MSQYLADHGWLWWILIGFLAGAIARAVTPGRDPSGCLITILLLIIAWPLAILYWLLRLLAWMVGTAFDWLTGGPLRRRRR